MAEYRQEMVNDGRGSLIPMPSSVNQDHLDVLSEHFAVYNDDIFIVGYPQSGINWMQQIVRLLVEQGERVEGLAEEAGPRLEEMPGAYSDVVSIWRNMSRPRCFCSHLPIQLLPGVHNSRARYICVARNPKDTAVSFYVHERAEQGFDGRWADFFELFFQGQVKFGPYFDHVQEWWQASRHMNHVIFVTFEAMQKDLAQVIGRVAQFIGVEAGEDLVRQLVAGGQAGAAALQADLGWVPQNDGDPAHLRQGEGAIGDWRKHFTVEQNIRFDALYTAKTLGTGLEFDFGEV